MTSSLTEHLIKCIGNHSVCRQYEHNHSWLKQRLHSLHVPPSNPRISNYQIHTTFTHPSQSCFCRYSSFLRQNYFRNEIQIQAALTLRVALTTDAHTLDTLEIVLSLLTISHQELAVVTIETARTDLDFLQVWLKDYTANQ